MSSPRAAGQANSGAETTTRLESARAAETAVTPPKPVAPGLQLADLVSLDPGATCLERDRLIERIARWLQRTRIDVPLRVHVRGDRTLPTRVFFAVVREPGDAAERRLDNAPSECDQLHSAVALSIALAIDATLQHPPGTPGAVAEDEPAKPAWKRKPPADPMHLDLAVLGGVSIGVLTGSAFAGTPRLALSPWSWLEIAVVGLATHLPSATFEQVPGSFRATLVAGGLDACFGGETSQGIGFFMCLGARVGWFQSRGSYNERSPLTTDPWWGLSGSGQGRFWLSGVFGIGTSVEALFALRDRELVVQGIEGAPTVYKRVPRLGLNVTIGPVFRFF